MSNKRKSYIVIASIIVLLLLCLLIDIFYHYFKTYSSLKLNQVKENIEYGSKFNIKDIFNTDNTVTLSEDIDTYVVDDYYIYAYVSKKDDKYNIDVRRRYPIVIKVEDTKGPEIILNEEEVIVYTNDSYHLRNNIVSVIDPIDGPVDDDYIVVKSDVDYSKAGTYTVEVKAYDNNGVESTKNYKLIVKDRQNTVTGDGYNYIYSYLTDVFGFNKAATCAILSNIKFESNFQTDIGDNYYGLCQWGGNRRDNLYTYCTNNGFDPSSYEGQLNFMYYELTNSYPSVLQYLNNLENSASGAYDGAEYFCEIYEGAASVEGRGQQATDYFNY